MNHSWYTSCCTDTIDKAFSALVKKKRKGSGDKGRSCYKLNIGVVTVCAWVRE